MDLPPDKSSYCLNTLYRMEMMARVLKQTSQLTTKTCIELEQKLEQEKALSQIKTQVECMKVRIKLLRNEEQKQIERIQRMAEDKKELDNEICEKGIYMLNKLEDLKREKNILNHERRKKLAESKERLLKTRAEINIRRKEILTELYQIYPIVPFPDKKGGHSICGIYLPNAERILEQNEVMVSVSLGFVAHMVLMISRFLDVPLRYQVIFNGSRSSIIDPLKEDIPVIDRNFPLYLKNLNKDRQFFLYGLYLLNKNIGQLMHYCGLPTPDLRATLPNLFSLFEAKFLLADSSPLQDNNRPTDRLEASPRVKLTSESGSVISTADVSPSTQRSAFEMNRSSPIPIAATFSSSTPRPIPTQNGSSHEQSATVRGLSTD